MERLRKLQELSIYEYGKRYFVEPETRHELVLSKISDVIEMYKPRVVVKAGLGSGKIIIDILGWNKDIVLVVVEPSLKVIEQFISDNKDNPLVEELRFINGDFRQFPVDYYAADLIISVDNLDVQETAPVIDEFRRALQFDGYFLFAGIVLDDEDLDGVFDDYMRIVSPLHNDFYLKDDLKTFLDLKEFSFIKGKIEQFEYSLNELKSNMKELHGELSGNPDAFVDENRGVFEELYELKDGTVKIPYFTGLFMRRKIRIENN
ncbi:MAG TPA: class I SAM-dependent methyltransferase [Spirochaetota bacterium]|nr:class I SAM-dependent methyltransferase [Spirochaetota bacterium]